VICPEKKGADLFNLIKLTPFFEGEKVDGNRRVYA